MSRRLTIGVLLTALGLGCVPPETPEPPVGLSTVRLPLVTALGGADQLQIVLLQDDQPVDTIDVPVPFPETLSIPVEPETEYRLTLSARAGDLPFARGESDIFTTPAEGSRSVTIIVDLLGVLRIVPLELPLGGLVSVDVRPLDPFPGQAERTPLSADGEGAFEDELPAGRYALELQLAEGFLDWQIGGTLEVEVTPGARRIWSEPIVDAMLPIPDPGIATVLEGVVEGGVLPAGLTPQPRDLILRALDENGRLATGYRGEVRFEPVEALDLLTAALLPDPYRFTADDAGEHRFGDGLLAPVSLLAGTLQVLVVDDTGLETRLTVPVQP